MKEKFEELIYEVLDFLINNKWVSALLFFTICSLISFFILYPINKSLAIGFISGASLTTIYKLLKF